MCSTRWSAVLVTTPNPEGELKRREEACPWRPRRRRVDDMSNEKNELRTLTVRPTNDENSPKEA